ncbi:carboxypeptidase C (cathepsin A) [Haloferula luteola]|uniref:Carboxypeptidase C (Cathepsin A) n=1 Tax=Haloferula luteola TaxID=595692 RepID=A0A840VAB0_9BACT|nr:peptidase S10 [Haloferula luteola]MBB5350719.1 carboxypeptidase C (cathepsin A) [Haloferula luteola]
MRASLLLLSLLTFVTFAAAAPSDAPESSSPPAAEKKEGSEKSQDPITKEDSVVIQGQRIPYSVTTSKLVLKKDDGTPRASIFNVSYVRQKVEDKSSRPVLFAFNGGPGSSSVWLHLGFLGPYRVQVPGDGTTAPEPPARIVPNEYSILDLADVVFIDPVSTGYSRTEKDTKGSDFHGVRQDIESVGDFIRRWVTENDRWASPKFLLGESYGGIRVSGLSEHLQSRFGMSLNGTILLSSLVDFRTLMAGEGDPLSYQVFLPGYTATAHFHGKIKGDRDALVQQAQEFAFGDYAKAFAEGNRLPAEQLDALAQKMSSLTGIDAELLKTLHLRLDPSRFRAELLRDQGKILGRFDARVAWPSTQSQMPYPEYDPSYSLALGAYSTAMLSYLGDHLGWKEDSPYEILTGKVQPWDMGRGNSYVNMTGELAEALRDNPHLRILIMEAACDLATPPAGIEYSLRQMIDAPESFTSRIQRTKYEAGHMFYLNPPDLQKARKDLAAFISGN